MPAQKPVKEFIIHRPPSLEPNQINAVFPRREKKKKEEIVLICTILVVV